MREIKFRAWNTAARQWQTKYSAFTLSGEKMTLCVNGDFHINADVCLEFQQYTGLKDKNGVEIYEGDIAKDDFREELCEIKFEDGSFVAHFTGNVIEYLSECADGIEVIGNVYENLELQEESKTEIPGFEGTKELLDKVKI